MRAIPSQIAIAALAACALLSACGGGDDSGNSGGATPAPSTTPSPSPTPSPAPSPDPLPAPRKGEALPSLSAPQTGSTAAVGNGSEGIWSESMGATFIDNAGRFVRGDRLGAMSGGFRIAGATWNFTPDTWANLGSIDYVTGSGTITPNNRLDGFYQTAGSDTQTPIHLIYDVANALAVEQASIQGDWKQNDFDISVDDQGNVNGTYTNDTQNCVLTGTAVLAEPGSAKNFYRVTLTASLPTQPAGTICPIDIGVPLQGYAAIRFVPADGSNLITSKTLYSRSLTMVATTKDGGYLRTQMLKK